MLRSISATSSVESVIHMLFRTSWTCAPTVGSKVLMGFICRPRGNSRSLENFEGPVASAPEPEGSEALGESCDPRQRGPAHHRKRQAVRKREPFRESLFDRARGLQVAQGDRLDPHAALTDSLQEPLCRLMPVRCAQKRPCLDDKMICRDQMVLSAQNGFRPLIALVTHHRGGEPSRAIDEGGLRPLTSSPAHQSLRSGLVPWSGTPAQPRRSTPACRRVSSLPARGGRGRLPKAPRRLASGAPLTDSRSKSSREPDAVIRSRSSSSLA